MKWFYSKKEKSELLGVVLFNDNEIETILGGNVFFDYPSLNSDNTAISDKSMVNPSWTGTVLIDKGLLANEDIIKDISLLNTPAMIYAMEQEGGTVKGDYLNYSIEKMRYDAQVQAEEKAKQEAYKQALQSNPDLTWEQFLAQYPTPIPVNVEPTIPDTVKKFMEDYL